MKYRGLLKGNDICKWVYGSPTQKQNSNKINTILEWGSVVLWEIVPETLGEETEYMDKHRKKIYTGDILSQEVNGEVQKFIVDRTTIDQEHMVIHESASSGIRVRLSGVIVLKQILPGGESKIFLPCVDHLGIDDCRRMEIIGTIHDKELCNYES